MTRLKLCTFSFVLMVGLSAHAQLHRTHIQGAASPFALSSDYRALGFNPALVSFPGWAGGYHKTSGGIEGGMSLRSNLLDRTEMWDQVLGRQQGEDSSWTTEEWLDALTDEELAFNMSFLTAAFARRVGNWGIAYANRRGVSAHITLSSKTAKLFTDGGLDLFSTIQLQGSDEIVSVEDYEFSIGDVWQGVDLAADATLANVLQETSLRYQSVRSHELGISRGWGDVIDGWALHAGVGGRLLLGSSYFDVHTEDGSVVAFGARSDGFSIQNLQSLDSLVGGAPSLDWVSVLDPAGLGWGLDAGVVLSRTDGLWLTASLVDVGEMTWEGEEYSVNNINVSLTPFATSDGAIDPDNWLSGAIDVLDAETWFQSSEVAKRKVSNRPMLALGAGFRPMSPVVLAGNLTVRSREALVNGGWSGGVSGGLRIANLWVVEAGVQRATSDVWRYPVSTRVSLQNGWEIGFRTGDVSAFWEGSQPEISMQTCFFRYRFSGL